MDKPNPWKRGRDVCSSRGGLMKIPIHSPVEKFDSYITSNVDMDFETKRAALIVSESVVCIISRIGKEDLFYGSGTIVKCEKEKNADGLWCSSIITSASLLRTAHESDNIKVNVYLWNGEKLEGAVKVCDLHYNIAVIQIKSRQPLQVAVLKLLNDHMTFGASWGPLLPHSGRFTIRPGDKIIALGRYCTEEYDLMAAAGEYSLDCCNFDCKDLLRANCRITKCGIGGPIINCYGEVIGLSFYDELCTPFLPINIVSKSIDYFENNGVYRRPWLGLEVTNFYAAHLSKIEFVVKSFPDICEGVFVEDVALESPADLGDVWPDDVIVQCDGQAVRSLLHFWEMIWDKTGNHVQLGLIRKVEGLSERVSLTIAVQENDPNDLNSWPLPKKSIVAVTSLR